MHKQKNLAIGALLVLALGTVTAWVVQTDRGNVSINDVRFVGAAGNVMSGLLYRPVSATADDPAPGILAVHGYINTRETQSGFAIEFARRGFVVLALDQTGHGYSDPPAFAHGFGGPDGLAYLRGLPFVDSERIGLEGHSMGGWTVQMAAAANPDGYQAMVLEGSSTGTFGAPIGTPDRPRNLLLVFSRFDEFSMLMWGVPRAEEIVGTDKLKQLFGTSSEVEPGREYGDREVGTARVLKMPAVTHPGDHVSREAIGAAVSWMQSLLGHGAEPQAMDQTWFIKEFATLACLIAVIVLLFPIVDRLLAHNLFGDVVTGPVRQGRGSVASAFVACVLPVLTFFPFQLAGDIVFPANPVFPQQITNGILTWAWGTGILSIVILLIQLRRQSLTLAEMGMPISGRVILNGVLLAAVTCGAIYFCILLADFLFNVDFRFWVVALKRLSADQFIMALFYLPLFAVFFLALSVTLHRVDRPAYVDGMLLSAGFLFLLVIQYAPLLAGDTLLLPMFPLHSIIAFQFVPVMFVVGYVSSYCFSKTNNIYTGAFINSVLVTWYIVAGTATQALPFWS